MDEGMGPSKAGAGLYKKYEVVKVGEETDPDARYFVLRLDSDGAARKAAMFYAFLVEDYAPELAEDLKKLVRKIDPKLEKMTMKTWYDLKSSPEEVDQPAEEAGSGAQEHFDRDGRWKGE